jgi:hypothetical protein
MTRIFVGVLAVVHVAAWGLAVTAQAQTTKRTPAGRVSVYVNTSRRDVEGLARRSDTELWTGIDLHTPDNDGRGTEFGIDLRHSHYFDRTRSERFSIYDGFVGVRLGSTGRVRLRAGHMWLTELGSIGAIAGGLAEVRLGGTQNDRDRTRVRLGGFSGVEPVMYGAGYVAGVRKFGGYAAIERGFLRRHLVGYTRVQHGSVIERSVVTFTNFIPAGRSLFVYQAGEFDVQGPANGTARRGLSYFLTNARVTPHSRLELLATYNRGRAIDARTLSDDVRNGRSLTTQAIEGLRYESAGGRVTVEVVPRVRVYAGYARDRNNRDDHATARVTLGGHAGNLLGTGFDVSASDARIERSTGSYHSRYVSVGHSIGRTIYVSGDYATSLSVVRFARSDGIIIETHPSTRRYAGNVSANLGRHWSLVGTVDYALDDTVKDLRLLSGLSYRVR